MAQTLGQRARMAVLVCDAGDHEDAGLSKKTLAANNGTGTIETWVLPREDHEKRYNQYKALVYAFQRAYEDPSVAWTVWANDHTFIVPENLACYLSSLSAKVPRYLGMRLWGPCCGLFNSGAAGFAVSRSAVGLLVTRWRELRDAGGGAEVDDKCDPSRPKAHIATCLAKLDKRAEPLDTRDADGAERFLVYGPVRLATGSIDNWLVSKKNNIQPPEGFKADGSVVASEVISFHYVAAQEHRLLHALLRDEAPLLADSTAAAQLRARWPSGREELGGYSGPWPSAEHKQDAVVSLLRRLRVCSPPAALAA